MTMDKDTRNYLEILMSQVDALGVRIGKLEAGCTMPHEPDGELVVKVIHRLPGEGQKI
jgi:hypothetical protein